MSTIHDYEEMHISFKEHWAPGKTPGVYIPRAANPLVKPMVLSRAGRTGTDNRAQADGSRDTAGLLDETISETRLLDVDRKRTKGPQRL